MFALQPACKREPWLYLWIHVSWISRSGDFKNQVLSCVVASSPSRAHHLSRSVESIPQYPGSTCLVAARGMSEKSGEAFCCATGRDGPVRIHLTYLDLLTNPTWDYTFASRVPQSSKFTLLYFDPINMVDLFKKCSKNKLKRFVPMVHGCDIGSELWIRKDGLHSTGAQTPLTSSKARSEYCCRPGLVLYQPRLHRIFDSDEAKDCCTPPSSSPAVQL